MHIEKSEKHGTTVLVEIVLRPGNKKRRMLVTLNVRMHVQFCARPGRSWAPNGPFGTKTFRPKSVPGSYPPTGRFHLQVKLAEMAGFCEIEFVNFIFIFEPAAWIEMVGEANPT